MVALATWSFNASSMSLIICYLKVPNVEVAWKDVQKELAMSVASFWKQQACSLYQWYSATSRHH